MKTYCSAGDLGDTIYSLPAIIKSLEGERADLVLYATKGMVRNPWTPASVLKVKDLLELQPCIERVRYEERAEGVILDKWRKSYSRRLNLADNISKNLRIPLWNPKQPWLVVDRAEEVAEVVMHRSPRYRADNFPWADAVATWGSRAVFVGSAEEYAEFTNSFGPIGWYPTITVLELARVIAGSKLYIGNQSAPLSLANGMCKKVWIELPKHPRNTIFDRPDVYTNPTDGPRITL